MVLTTAVRASRSRPDHEREACPYGFAAAEVRGPLTQTWQGVGGPRDERTERDTGRAGAETSSGGYLRDRKGLDAAPDALGMCVVGSTCWASPIDSRLPSSRTVGPMGRGRDDGAGLVAHRMVSSAAVPFRAGGVTVEPAEGLVHRAAAPPVHLVAALRALSHLGGIRACLHHPTVYTRIAHCQLQSLRRMRHSTINRGGCKSKLCLCASCYRSRCPHYNPRSQPIDARSGLSSGPNGSFGPS
jgi:hypothetical protein